jgi:hypothetical protein
VALKKLNFSTPSLVVNSFRVLLVLADIEVRMEILGQPEVRTPDKKKKKITFTADSHEQLISYAGWSKLDFAERDQSNRFLGDLIGWKSGKALMSLYGAEWREAIGYGL